MKHGDLSNKPSQSLVVRLENFADIKYSRFLKKLTLDIATPQPIVHLNNMFLRRDIQIVVAAVMPKKHQKEVEDFLDDAGLLFKEVVIAETEEEMEDIKREQLLMEPEPYFYNELWT